MSPTFLGLPAPLPPVAPEEPLRWGPTFPAAAAQTLRNQQMRANLRRATHTIRDKRLQVTRELPDWEELRAAGSAIKQDAMARLPELLVQLESNVRARGGVVHWAADAEEANRIVTDLVTATGASQVVKVKSMATQEIGLNEHLAAAGIRAVETDLAELIVQLAGDQPSHILVPAIHRNREEIRRIFAARMPAVPADLSDDPRQLTMAARAHLRSTFLTARVAISGANLAVADTGTVAVFESEGNGRMCLTLPDTLITVMGIEKVIPSFRDLEVFTQLLPRSSTGERMNPYTSMWTGVTPGDGPSSFHLVLVDNGRTRVLADPVGRQALHCIRCSACLNVCPVYEQTGGHAYGSVYPGPIGAILTPQLLGIGAGARPADPHDPATTLPFASSLCWACYDACPVRIDIPTVLVHLRNRINASVARRGRPTAWQAGMAAASRVMSSGRRFAAAAGAARVGRLLARQERIGPLPLPVLRTWTAARDLPAPPGEPFRDWWARHQSGATPAAGPLRTSPVTPGGDPAVTPGGDPGSAPPSARAARHRKRPVTRPVRRSWLTRARRRRLVEPSTRLASAPSRHLVLARTHAALARATPQAPAVPRTYRVTSDVAPGSAEACRLLASRLEGYRARVHPVGEPDLAGVLTGLLVDAGTVVLPPGLPTAWRQAAADAGCTLLDDTPERPLGTDVLDAAGAVLTGARVAIAETGTIVLDAAEGQGRRALTLVPDRHVCVVRADQVVATVPEAVALLAHQPTRPLTWVAGPSATSDIELHRVEGVHGPRVLDVVLVS